MLKNPLFREKALLRHAQPDPLDDLVRVTAPHEWILLSALAALLLATVAWCAFASVERTLPGDAVLVRPGERHTVTSGTAGIVAEVMAREGDRVEAGQAIARLTMPELDWRLRVARAKVALLEEQPGRFRGTAPTETGQALAAARAEAIELAAIVSAGRTIVSPYAGELVASSLVAGHTVRAGEPVFGVRADAGGAPQAIMIVPPGQAARIESGMRARVAIPDRTGPRVVPGMVLDVSARSQEPPPWLVRLGLGTGTETGAAGRMVRLALEGGETLPVRDGASCRVEIVLARSSLIGLLNPPAGGAE